MSYISEEISRQIKTSKLSQAEVSRRSKISQAQLSNWINEVQTSITGPQLDALSHALSADPIDHARMLVAHLKDERVGSARDLVRIELDTVAELNDRPRPRTKGERAIQFLADQRMENRDVNDLVIDLARCLGANLEEKSTKVNLPPSHKPSSGSNPPVLIPGFEQQHAESVAAEARRQHDNKEAQPSANAPDREGSTRRSTKAK